MSDKHSPDFSNNKIEDAEFLQSKRAEIALESLIKEATAEDIISHDLTTSSVDEERSGGRVLEHVSERAKSRILFVTQDTSYLEKNSAALVHTKKLAKQFDEVHIMVLLPLGGKVDTKRIAPHVWVYRARAQYWWQLPNAALSTAKEQLLFMDGFRADIIVALDPFESGWAVHKIARTFDRPYQIHVATNFFADKFKTARKHNKWRVRIAKYVLKRAPAIRTSTNGLMAQLQKKFKKVTDIRVSPHFYNFSGIIHSEPAFDVHKRYNTFIYTALAFGPLSADSHLHDTFSALHQVLHNPRVGLIVFGDGPAKELFQEKVTILGIEKNVIFLNAPDDLISYLKTADVLVQTDASKAGDEIVLKAAAAGLPTVMYENDVRKDLFVDGESATLCEKGDVSGIEKGFKALLNNQGLRTQYEGGARNVVETRLVEDEETYYRALRDSIEITLNTDPAAKSNEKT